jgi:EAL domain-containing protein (putative c-di-GMP-specific phosphodiesterase class I)
MALQSSNESQARLLLVGDDPAWSSVVGSVAARLGAALDIMPDTAAALGGMLRPGPIYSHVLAVGPIGTKSVDALAGMLDEVTLRPTRLLLLGTQAWGDANALTCLPEPDADRLLAALRCQAVPPPAGLPPLTPSELGDILHEGGLRMRFQPVIDARAEQPIGMEALARIHHPVRGILHPKDFIPVTVASGRERVLAGIAAARTFLDMGYRLHGSGLFVSLNVPLAIILSERALRRALELCAVASVAPSKLVIEVLESRDMPDLPRLRRALEAWRAAGFRMAIDDAGPALPHWRALLDLPFDIVKLDGTLVADPAAHGLVAEITREAKSHGCFVVAEGIENEACRDRMVRLGADALQGFLFSRPLPALAVPIWLRQFGLVPTVQAA